MGGTCRSNNPSSDKSAPSIPRTHTKNHHHSFSIFRKLFLTLDNKLHEHLLCTVWVHSWKISHCPSQTNCLLWIIWFYIIHSFENFGLLRNTVLSVFTGQDSFDHSNGPSVLWIQSKVESSCRTSPGDIDNVWNSASLESGVT
jgi:hypothetical protein